MSIGHETIKKYHKTGKVSLSKKGAKSITEYIRHERKILRKKGGA